MRAKKIKAKSKQGYVYILTNPSFREDWVKIGKTSDDPKLRARQLDTTSIPLPFKVFAWARTKKYEELEKHIHTILGDYANARIRRGREFFNVTPKKALAALEDAARLISDVKIHEAWLDDDDEDDEFNTSKVAEEPRAFAKASRSRSRTKPPRKRPVEEKKVHRTGQSSPFRFSMVGIGAGKKLVFVPTGLVVEVANDREIIYRGKRYKLSPFTGEFLPANQRNKSGAYQGPNYFTYKGKTLADLRREKEARK